jgi:cbb3-type cytochrome oxidase subunit 3
MTIKPKKWWWRFSPHKRKIVKAAEFYLNQEEIQAAIRLEIVNKLMNR